MDRQRNPATRRCEMCSTEFPVQHWCRYQRFCGTPCMRAAKQEAMRIRNASLAAASAEYREALARKTAETRERRESRRKTELERIEAYWNKVKDDGYYSDLRKVFPQSTLGS